MKNKSGTSWEGGDRVKNRIHPARGETLTEIFLIKYILPGGRQYHAFANSNLQKKFACGGPVPFTYHVLANPNCQIFLAYGGPFPFTNHAFANPNCQNLLACGGPFPFTNHAFANPNLSNLSGLRWAISLYKSYFGEPLSFFSRSIQFERTKISVVV